MTEDVRALREMKKLLQADAARRAKRRRGEDDDDGGGALVPAVPYGPKPKPLAGAVAPP
jgi:hypothetical protein